MSRIEVLNIPFSISTVPVNGGLFISSGVGVHETRSLDTSELILVKTGTLELFEDEYTYHLSPGDTIILQAGRTHGGAAPYQPDLSFYWLHFVYPPEEKRRGAETLTVPTCTPIRDPERFIELFHIYLDDQETGRLTRHSSSLLLLLMLNEIGNTVSDKPPTSEESCPTIVSRIERYIAAHYHEPIRTATIAASMKNNPDYIERVFHETRGYSITRAINRRRIRDAKTLLIQNYMNIEEVAYSCGYQDAGYFRRVFKRMTGTTPHAFRKKHCHLHINSH